MADSPVQTEPVDAGQSTSPVTVNLRVGNNKRKRFEEDENGRYIKNQDIVAQLCADIAVMKHMLKFCKEHGDVYTRYVTEEAGECAQRAQDHAHELMMRLG